MINLRARVSECLFIIILLPNFELSNYRSLLALFLLFFQHVSEYQGCRRLAEIGARPRSIGVSFINVRSCSFNGRALFTRLPEDGEKNILITSALPYCNNVPHLGMQRRIS